MIPMQALPDQKPEIPDEQPWTHPAPGESERWFQRLSLYCAMGPCRSVRAVYNAELAERGKASQTSKSVPSSWTQAAHRFDWQGRAKAFDEWRRKEIFHAGNAADTERIRKLDGLIEKLSARCSTMLDGMYMAEINPEDLSRLITALLSALDLMAKHTGGYAAQRIEHTGKDGKAIEIHEEQTKVNVVFYVPEIGSLHDDLEADPDQIEDLQSHGGVDALPHHDTGE